MKRGKLMRAYRVKERYWRENDIKMKLQIAIFPRQDCESNGCGGSSWLWASIKIDLNEFRVAVWHCISAPWHASRIGGDGWCEEEKHTPRNSICTCCESARLSDCVCLPSPYREGMLGRK